MLGSLTGHRLPVGSCGGSGVGVGVLLLRIRTGTSRRRYIRTHPWGWVRLPCDRMLFPTSRFQTLRRGPVDGEGWEGEGMVGTAGPLSHRGT